jgi:hypothetical protein
MYYYLFKTRAVAVFLGIFSGIFSYLFSRNVTSTNDVIVVYNHGKPSARRFSAAKALEIILAGSGSEDDEIDIDREVGTRGDDDFIPDQEELSDTEDRVTRRPKQRQQK